MDLLTNAVESIQVGVEDYQSGTRPRLLSAGRNIHAGILLLYKEALRRESPKDSNDALLMSKIVPSRDANGNVVFVGEGKKTVDTQQIRERFQALGVSTDWNRFDRINNVRNDVEHFYPLLDQKALHGLISDSFLIVRNFIADELEDDPRDLLAEETWQPMLDVSVVHEKEKQECERLLKDAKWVSPTLKRGLTEMVLTCSACGSDLLKTVSFVNYGSGISRTSNSPTPVISISLLRKKSWSPDFFARSTTGLIRVPLLLATQTTLAQYDQPRMYIHVKGSMKSRTFVVTTAKS
jgi:hypothetical protein